MTAVADTAREQLIERHLPLVRTLARRYAGRGETVEDLVQVGSVGLIKAADRFEPRRGVPFPAFATLTVEGEIRRHLRDRAWPVRPPRRVEELRAAAHRRRGDLAAELGREPSLAELARALEATPDDVREALGLEAAGEASDVAGRDRGTDAFAASLDRTMLATSLRRLDGRDRQIVYLRFHAELSEAEIARELEISQSQVSRRLRAALRRLEVELSDIAPEPVVSPPIAPPPAREDPLPTAAGKPRLATMPVREVAPPEDYLDRPYHIAVARDGPDEGDSAWVAQVEELPGCEARGRTPDEAVHRLRSAMEGWVAGALAERREIPPPRGAPTHSGRLLLRMPQTLHADLARAAERDDASLNQLIVGLLSAALARGDEPVSRAARRDPLRIALVVDLLIVAVAVVAAVVLVVLALGG